MELALFDQHLVCWFVEPNGNFSIASCYQYYASLRIPFGPPKKHDALLSKIWKMDVPYKIKDFG